MPPPPPLPDRPLVGTSPNGPGVDGGSNNGDGVLGIGNPGVRGGSWFPHGEGVWGENHAGGNGVKGSTNSPYVPGEGGTAGVWGDNAGTGTGVKGTSAGGDAVLGFSTAPNHAGVSAVNDSGGFGIWAMGTPAGHFEGNAGAVGVYAQGGSNSAGLVGQAGPGAQADGVQGFGNGPNSGVAGFGGADNGNGSGTGVFGQGGTPIGTGVGGIGGGGPNTLADYAVGVGVYGQGGPGNAGVYGRGGLGGASGTGVIGIGASVTQVFEPVVDVGVYGQCEGGNLSAGVQGSGGRFGGDGVYGEANATEAAGIFGFGLPDNYAGYFFGNVTVTGKLNVLGTYPDGTQRRLYYMASPECWFEDFGTGQLVDGQAQVQLDPGFASVVGADDYHVFLTEYENNNGLYVTGRTNTGFGVRAKALPNVSGTFSYRVVAKRKDIVAPRFDQATLRQPRPAKRAAGRASAAPQSPPARPTP